MSHKTAATISAEVQEIARTLGNVVEVGPGKTYESIAVALTFVAAQSPSSINPWIINVAPGVYVEPLLSVPGFVFVVGSSIYSTIITPDGAHNVVEIAGSDVEISFLTIKDAPTGYYGVLLNDIAGWGQLHKVSFSNCARPIGALSATNDVELYCEYVDIEADWVEQAVLVQAAGGSVFANFENFYTYAGVGNTAPHLKITGAGAEVHFASGQLLGDGGDTGFRVLDGAMLDIGGVIIESLDSAVQSVAGGVAPTIRVSAAFFEGCTLNLDIQHTGTVGHLLGFSPRSKNDIQSESFAILGAPRTVVTVRQDGSGDFDALEDALASITDNSPSNPYTIQLHGDFVVDNSLGPIALKSDVDIVSLSGIESGASLTAGDPNQDLFTAAGRCSVVGVTIGGVTNVAKYCILNGQLDGVFALRNVGAGPCSNFCRTYGGASTIFFAFSAAVTAAAAARSVLFDIDTAGNVRGSGLFAAVPSAVLPAYPGVDPIKHVIRADGAGSRFFVNAGSFDIAANTSAQADVLVNNGATGVLNGVDIVNSGTAVWLGATAGNVVTMTGCNLTGNTTNIKIEASDGVVFNVGSVVDDLSLISLVSGARVVRLAAQTSDGSLRLADDTLVEFDEDGKTVALGTALHSVSSTGLGRFRALTEGKVTHVSALNVAVAAGDGMIAHETSGSAHYVAWSAVASLAMTASATNYVYYSGTTDAIAVSTSPVNVDENILLAEVVTDGSEVIYIHDVSRPVKHGESLIWELLDDIHETLRGSGLVVSQNGTTPASRIDVASGYYWNRTTKCSISALTAPTMNLAYGTDGATLVKAQTDINLTQYDSAGSLTAMTAAYYRADTVYVTSDGKITVIYGTAEYATQGAAEDASHAAAPSYIAESAFALAKLIVQKTTGIVAVVDLRPQLGTSVASSGTVTDHDDLTNRNDVNNHPWALAINGSRAMTGALDMGAQAITNVGNVDGVDVSAHASRHQPGGADAIATAAASEITDSTNGAGTAASLARSDHQHAHGNRGGGSLHSAATTGAAGFMSAADKTKLDGIPTGGYPQYTNAPYPGSSTTTTSATHGLMSGMTLTPGAGTYLLFFDAVLSHGSNDASIYYQIYVNGVAQGTERQWRRGGGQGNVVSSANIAGQVVTAAAAQAVEIRWRTSAGTATAAVRNLTLIKVAA